MFFSEVQSLHTSEISHWARSRIPVLSAGNVFQRSLVFINIRDLTRGRSRIFVLSAGNVFHRSPVFVNIHIRDLTRGREAVFLS
ncbi:unnamed protein product [Staurois parvus]|uniref:Uncharacterized protein n=1 Tax=Staurois parvus TaxID=386267 RepID=A0ABN9C198_9NEOB|nr:unnamed protein product [Staurois parvus]